MRIYLDGEFVDESAARIAPGDAGLLRGEGVFETVRVDDGKPCDLGRHMQRLGDGARALGLSLHDTDDLAAAARQLAAAAPRPVARLRLTVTAGRDGVATRLITAHRWQPPADADYVGGVPVIGARRSRIDSHGPLRGVKSTSYALYSGALRGARESGAYEALLGNERGELAEGSRSNVFVLLDGRAVTPPLASGCLPGIARRRILELELASEAAVLMADLQHADGMFLSNSLIGVLPVASIDERRLPVDGRARRWRDELEAAWERG